MSERKHLRSDMLRSLCQHLHFNLYPKLNSVSEVDQLIQTFVYLPSDYKCMHRQATDSYDALSSWMIPMNFHYHSSLQWLTKNMTLNENRKVLSTEDNTAGVSV